MNTQVINRTMRDFLLEAAPDEIDQLAREMGFNPKELAHTGRQAVEHAVAQSNQDASRKDNIVLLHQGLNTLLVMLRRRDGFDEAELARKAEIDEEEVRRIEFDPDYLPSPRTIYKLERTFALQAGVLAKLSGAIKTQSPALERRVLQFAANAKSMGKLSKAERDLLNAFIKFLTEHD